MKKRNFKTTYIRDLSHHLFRFAEKIAAQPPDKKNRIDWVRAMAAETNFIPSDLETLEFAFNCWFMITMETLKMKKFVPVIKLILAALTATWALGKLYLLNALITQSGIESIGQPPAWLIIILAIAALIYTGLAVTIFTNRYITFSTLLVAAIITNSILFSLTQFQFYLSNMESNIEFTWHLAIVSEEYFMWSAVTFGTIVTLLLKNFDRTKAFVFSS